MEKSISYFIKGCDSNVQQIANYKYSEFKLKQEVNMKTRKVATTLLAIATLMSTFIFPSFAKNNHDVEFSYSLPNEGYYQVYGVGQRKEDASGSYVYSYSSNPAGGTYYSIHGGHTTSLSNGYVNCTKNDSAVIYAGQKRRIRQYVYEWGYAYAFIGLAPTSGQSRRTINGKWSPDTLGYYPYAN